MSPDEPRYLACGEGAITVEFGQTADPVFHDRVLALDRALARTPVPGIVETVPTYRSLLVSFDHRLIDADSLTAALKTLDLGATETASGRSWLLPACYEGPHGEDLAELAALLDLSTDEIVTLHAGAVYRAVMYGFAPGFVFLSGLPDALRVSRRPTPRPPAQPGALTIANGQALIASVAMPTGWYVVGRTPARTFDLARDPVFPIAVGDTIRFEPIDAARFDELDRAWTPGAPFGTPLGTIVQP